MSGRPLTRPSMKFGDLKETARPHFHTSIISASLSRSNPINILLSWRETHFQPASWREKHPEEAEVSNESNLLVAERHDGGIGQVGGLLVFLVFFLPRSRSPHRREDEQNHPEPPEALREYFKNF